MGGSRNTGTDGGTTGQGNPYTNTPVANTVVSNTSMRSGSGLTGGKGPQVEGQEANPARRGFPGQEPLPPNIIKPPAFDPQERYLMYQKQGLMGGNSIQQPPSLIPPAAVGNASLIAPPIVSPGQQALVELGNQKAAAAAAANMEEAKQAAYWKRVQEGSLLNPNDQGWG